MLFWKVKRFLLFEEIKVVTCYYYNCQFALGDLILKIQSFFINPYRRHRKFMQKMGKEPMHSYGETPISQFAKIIKKISITPQDHFVDLGSGRGRLAMWMDFFYPCRVSAIEYCKPYNRTLAVIVSFLRRKKFSILTCDYREIDLSSYSIIYCYATMLSEEEKELVEKKLSLCSFGTKILVVGDLLRDSAIFTQISKDSIFLPWGKTDLLLYHRN